MIERELNVGDHIITQYGYPYRILEVHEDHYVVEGGALTIDVSKDGTKSFTSSNVPYYAEWYECPSPTYATIFDHLVKTIAALDKANRELYEKLEGK